MVRKAREVGKDASVSRPNIQNFSAGRFMIGLNPFSHAVRIQVTLGFAVKAYPNSQNAVVPECRAFWPILKKP